MRHSCIRAFASRGFRRRTVHRQRRPVQADDRAVSLAGVSVGAGVGEEGRPRRVDRVRARASQHLHGRRARLQTGSPDEVPRRRRRHSLRARDLRRRIDRHVRARQRAESRRVDRQPEQRSARTAIARSGRRTRTEAARGDLAPAPGRRCRPTATPSCSRATARSSAYQIVPRADGAGREGPAALYKGMGAQREPALVARRIQARVRQRARQPLADRRLRRYARDACTTCRRASTSTPVRRGRPTANGSRSFGARACRSGCRRKSATGASATPAARARRVAAAAVRARRRGGRGAGARRRSRRRLVSRGVHGRLYDFSDGRRHRRLPDAGRWMRSARVLAQPAERQGVPDDRRHRVGGRRT